MLLLLTNDSDFIIIGNFITSESDYLKIQYLIPKVWFVFSVLVRTQSLPKDLTRLD